MNKITLRCRLMSHLYSYSHVNPEIRFGAPFELTQDGIAMCLGITRSYASLILKRLEENGDIEHGESLVNGSMTKCKRKIYFLTPLGRTAFMHMLEELHRNGISEADLIQTDLNHCSIESVMSLDPEQRDLVGCLCVLRVPVSRSDLPDKIPAIIPFDMKHRVYIKPGTKERLESIVKSEDVRRWHSLAADWCTDKNLDIKERLHHLVLAGRCIEANKLIASNRYVLMEDADKDLAETLRTLCSEAPNPMLCETAARIHIGCSLLDEAEALLKLPDMEGTMRDALMAEVLLDKGMTDEAMGLALRCYCGDGSTGIALGRCMMAEGRYKEARIFLAKARKSMIEDGGVFELERVLLLEAETAALQKQGKEASNLADLAECVMRRKDTLTELNRVRGLISEHGIGLEAVKI